MPYLMASYVRKGDRLPSFAPEGQIASGVMVASNQPLGEQLQSYGSGLPSPVSYSGRTPSGSGHTSSAARTLQTFDERAPLPQAAPRPEGRPADRSSGFATAARQPQRMPAPVAAAPTYVAEAEPARQTTRQQVRQPVQAPALAEARPASRPQFAPAEMQRPAARGNERTVRTAEARPVAQPQRAPAHVSETAYANTPRSPEPIVMFGNMVLRNPSR